MEEHIIQPFSTDARISDPDVYSMLLADKRSENTKRAYAHDLKQFFVFRDQQEPTPELIRSFLALRTQDMVRDILRYKSYLIALKLAEATINRRLAAISSLVRFARRLGLTEANPGESVDAEKVKAYRDTRGIDLNEAKSLLKIPDRSTLKGKRDHLLLLMLLENALRRAELTGLTLGNVSPDRTAVWVLGKGRGTQRERVTLSAVASETLNSYLTARESRAGDTGQGRAEAPLFISVSPAWFGRPLTPDGVYKIVVEIARAAGLNKRLSPHQLRHTSITLALDASGGDIRKVRRLSRHARLETLQIYDDNRSDLQGEMTQQLSQLLDSES